MALSLGIHFGSKIRIGEHIVKVAAIVAPTVYLLTVDNGPELLVSDQETTEILPGVTVFVGTSKTGSINRLAFTAPRSIVISRVEEDSDSI
jgi:hypothetical protein